MFAVDCQLTTASAPRHAVRIVANHDEAVMNAKQILSLFPRVRGIRILGSSYTRNWITPSNPTAHPSLDPRYKNRSRLLATRLDRYTGFLDALSPRRDT